MLLQTLLFKMYAVTSHLDFNFESCLHKEIFKSLSDFKNQSYYSKLSITMLIK